MTSSLWGICFDDISHTITYQIKKKKAGTLNPVLPYSVYSLISDCYTLHSYPNAKSNQISRQARKTDICATAAEKEAFPKRHLQLWMSAVIKSDNFSRRQLPKMTASANDNEWKVMGLMSVALSSCTAVAFNLHLDYFFFPPLPFLYHLLRTQEGATHPWYNLSSSRHHSGASSPGIPQTHCCVLGDAYSLCHQLSAFLRWTATASSAHLRLFNSKAMWHNQLLSVDVQIMGWNVSYDIHSSW